MYCKLYYAFSKNENEMNICAHKLIIISAWSFALLMISRAKPVTVLQLTPSNTLLRKPRGLF